MNDMNNMRKYELDNLRYFTVILVVIYHVIYMYNGEASDGVAGPFRAVQYQDAFQYLVYPWFMNLLFMISGIAANLSLQTKSPREFLKARARRLLVPTTVGLLVFQWITGYFNMTLSDAFRKMGEGIPGIVTYLIMALSGTGVLWYIQMLFVFSLLLLPLRALFKGRLVALGEKTPTVVLILLAAVALGAAQILNTPYITVYRFGIYGFSFFLGYLVLSHDTVRDRIAAFSPVLTGSAAVLGGAYAALYFGENYAVEPTVNCPLAVIFGYFACLAALGLGRRFFNKETRFTRFMAPRSFGLYVFHYLPIAVCGVFLPRTDFSPAVIYLITLIAAFGGGFLLNAVISRIPVVRWCVLGISSPKKEKTKNVQ